MKMRLYPCVALFALLAACETETMGPVAPPSRFQPGTGEAFNEQDFAWSRAPGSGAIYGVMAYHSGEVRYSCSGRDVILAPETPWVRRRMYILYGSTDTAAVPVDIVRARTPAANGSSGDYASYARKTTCDAANRFSFKGLPDGAWYVLTLARPEDRSSEAVAVMRRVETHGGSRGVVLD